jgi:hypothetical protein
MIAENLFEAAMQMLNWDKHHFKPEFELTKQYAMSTSALVF